MGCGFVVAVVAAVVAVLVVVVLKRYPVSPVAALRSVGNDLVQVAWESHS